MKAQAMSSVESRLPPVTCSIAWPSTQPPDCSKPSNTIPAAAPLRLTNWRPRSPPPLPRKDGAGEAGRWASGGGLGLRVSTGPGTSHTHSPPRATCTSQTGRGLLVTTPPAGYRDPCAEDGEPTKWALPVALGHGEESDRCRHDHALRAAGREGPRVRGARRRGPAREGVAEGSGSSVVAGGGEALCDCTARR